VTFSAEAEPDWAVIFEGCSPQTGSRWDWISHGRRIIRCRCGRARGGDQGVGDIDDVNNADKKWAKLTDALVEVIG
jgi:hypothetical protein